MLSERGIITKVDDPTHKQKAIYSLTEQGIELVPLLAQIGAWGVKHLPVTEELGVRAELLAAGGPAMWSAFMNELRERHLGAPAPRKTRSCLSVTEQLEAACKSAIPQRGGRQARS
jgi:DNA-binding MarR family transcriptional regulator